MRHLKRKIGQNETRVPVLVSSRPSRLWQGSGAQPSHLLPLQSHCHLVIFGKFLFHQPEALITEHLILNEEHSVPVTDSCT